MIASHLAHGKERLPVSAADQSLPVVPIASGMLILGVVAAGALLGVVVVELSHYLAMRGLVASSRAGHSARERTSEAVIVLGFPPRRHGRTNAVQRWRCRIAVRSLDPGRSSVLIMTGAATRGRRSEAEVMAGYARDRLGVPARHIMLEEQARSTWDNIRYSLPLAEQFAAIKVASDPFHVRKAHRYVARIRPDLVTRLEPARCYRPGEYLLLKAAIVAYEIRSRLQRRGIALLSGS
jgi:uncharacterized SAM-binding protein YcdF (DUF218 family)